MSTIECIGVNLVIWFDKNVRFVKKVKNHWLADVSLDSDYKTPRHELKTLLSNWPYAASAPQLVIFLA